MPGCDWGSYPALVALTVYVSGGSEMKEKAPEASDVLCAVCDGEEAITTAPAIGACVAASTTRPFSVPVVPAIVSAGMARSAKANTAMTAFLIKKNVVKLAE